MKVRYSLGWMNPREMFGSMIRYEKEQAYKLYYGGVESIEKKWSCPYCRNLYTDQSPNCRSCGAPK